MCILVAINYASKWIEVATCKNNYQKTVIKFLNKHILFRFGVPKVIICDGGSHFCNRIFENLTKKYDITHKISTVYHSQLNGQVELTNREIKEICEKIVSLFCKDWSF